MTHASQLIILLLFSFQREREKNYNMIKTQY